MSHSWTETGIRRQHVEGHIFKYGTRVVAYVRCARCGQAGFRYPGRRVVYTWRSA